MNVEYTGRQFEITPRIRKEVETGLAKIVKILGDNFEAKVTLTVEKHRHKAEVTISPRNQQIVGLAESSNMISSINQAMGHLERQALKYKTRWRTKKRQPRSKYSFMRFCSSALLAASAMAGIKNDASKTKIQCRFIYAPRFTL